MRAVTARYTVAGSEECSATRSWAISTTSSVRREGARWCRAGRRARRSLTSIVGDLLNSAQCRPHPITTGRCARHADTVNAMTMHTGGCDCRGVRYELEGELRDVFNCHCERCRRITGHHMAATAVRPEQIRFQSDSTLRWYDPVDTVHYGFCGVCGSTLF